MSLAILFHLCAKHVSDINISIIRGLRLFCRITTLVVLFLVRCVLEFRCGWVGVVLYNLMFIGSCIIVIVEEKKTNLMSLAILFHFLCAQHVSDINISIIRSLRLFCWITTLVVLFLARCVLEFRCGWVGVVLYNLMYIGPCIIVIVEEEKTNFMSFAISFHFLCAQHVSDINIAIIRGLRLCCWITTFVVLFLVRCVLEFRCGWVGVVLYNLMYIGPCIIVIVEE